MIGTKVVKEERTVGEEINYTYNSQNNITSKEIKQDGDVVALYTYSYNALERLTNENVTKNGLAYRTNYQYDNRGNIIKKRYYLGNYNYRDDNYFYSDSNSDMLEKVEKVDKTGEADVTTIIKEYCYGTKFAFNPTSLILNSGTTSQLTYNLSWEGRNLTGFGSYMYGYNENNIRVMKGTTGKVTSFILEGTKVVCEKIEEEIQGDDYIRYIYYHYDEVGSLLGFNFNNKEYIYIKDITGTDQ